MIFYKTFMRYINFLIFAISLVAFTPTNASLVSLDQADYVIVINSQLYDASLVNQIVALKESQGLSVAQLVIPDATWANPALCWSQKNIRDELSSAYFSGNKKMKYS